MNYPITATLFKTSREDSTKKTLFLGKKISRELFLYNPSYGLVLL